MEVSEKITFKILEKEHIEECSLLIENTYMKFNTLATYLDEKPGDIQESAKKILSDIQEDEITMIATDENGKIVGCFLGWKMDKLQNILKKEIPRDEIYHFNSQLGTVPIIAELENILLKEEIEKLKIRDEAQYGVYSTFFCVHEVYMGTSVARELALNFCLNIIEKGYKYVYAMTNNIRALKISSKILGLNKIKELKFLVDKNGEKREYERILLYATAEILKKKKKDSPTPKF